MRKVIKILLSIISTLILVAIIAPLFLSLLLQIGVVQNYVTRASTELLSEKMGLELSVEKINLKLFNKVSLTGVYMSDYGGDTLFYAKNLTVGITKIDFKNVVIDLSSINLTEPELYMHQMPSGYSNFNEILLKYKKEDDKESKFTLKSDVVNISGMKYKNTRTNPEIVPSGVNFEDLDVSYADINASDMVIVGDSVNLKINNLEIKEKSGIHIYGFEAKDFVISSSCMKIDDFRFRMTDSYVNANYLNFSYNDWLDYQDFIRLVDMSGSFFRSRVSSEDIAFFAPELNDWNAVYRNFTAKADGTVSDLDVRVSNLQTSDNTTIKTDVRMTGLPDTYNTVFDIDVKSLQTTIAEADTLLRGIVPTIASFKNEATLSSLGEINLKGDFKGYINDFKATIDAKTQVGDITAKASMKTDSVSNRKRHRIKADLDATNLSLGKIIDNNDLGKLSLNAGVSLRLIDNAIYADVVSSLTELEYKGYSYSNLHVNALVNNKKYQAIILSQDKNLVAELDAKLDMSSKLPNYSFDVAVDKADLQALKIYSKEAQASNLSFGVSGKGEGLTFKDLAGTIDFDDITYDNAVDTVSTGRILVTGENNLDDKYVSLTSSLLDVNFKSRLSTEQLDDFMHNLVYEYLPMLNSSDSKAMSLADFKTKYSDDYSMLNVEVKNIDDLTNIFVPGLKVAPGSTLSFLANANQGDFSLTMQSDFIQKDKFYVSYINANAYNQSKDMSLYFRAEEVYASGIYMPKFSMVVGARDNKIDLSARYTNTKDDVSALVNLTALVSQDKDRNPELAINFNNSTLKNKTRIWDISSNEINYTKTRIDINDFVLKNNNQSLFVDGVLSKNTTDTLKIALHSFDISPITGFTQSLGYDVQGRTTGNIDIVSVLKDPNLFANLGIGQMKINDTSLPNSIFTSQWDFLNQRARFQLKAEDVNRPIVNGYYSPSDGRYMADINLVKVDLALLDPLLKGVLVGSRGYADAQLSLLGSPGKPVLNGSIQVDTLRTKVDYTNVDYMTSAGEIIVKNNVFSLSPVDVYDNDGNKAVMTLNLDNEYFKHFAFDINILLEEPLMVLNTTKAINDDFYGKIYATGGARISGDDRGVEMDIIASTEGNSSFIVPLGGKSSISAADFIVFKQPEQKRDSTQTKLSTALDQIMQSYTSQANMNINMALTINPNATVTLDMNSSEGGVLRGQGNGLLNINVNPTNNVFTMYGDYSFTEGLYMFSLQNIINKRFSINEGSSISWTGDPSDATLDITAVYKVKASLEPLMTSSSSTTTSDDLEDTATSSSDDTYSKNISVDCEIMLSDRLHNPTVTFNVAVPTVDAEIQSVVSNALNTQELMATQFFTLLAFNSFYSDADSQSLDIGTGGVVTGFEFLSSQISNLISSDKYNIGIRYRPKGDTTSDELDIGLSTSIIDDRLLVEVEGNFDFGNNSSIEQTTTNSITGDFYLTWLLDKAGSIKTKAFTRTMDRFDENQDMQESGIGIYYTENFNKFSDIITNFRNRYKIKRRKKKLEKQEKKEGKEETKIK